MNKLTEVFQPLLKNLTMGRHYATLLEWDTTKNRCGDNYFRGYELHFPFAVVARTHLQELQGIVK